MWSCLHVAQSAALLTAIGRCKMFHTNHTEVIIFISICIYRVGEVSLTSTSSASEANTTTVLGVISINLPVPYCDSAQHIHLIWMLLYPSGCVYSSMNMFPEPT